MENEYPKGKHFLKLFLIALAIFSVMLVCALLGYSFAKNDAGNKNNESIKTEDAEIFVNEPVELLVPSEEPDVSEQIETAPPPDENDYLVIWENDAVKLYLINKDGELLFSRNLEISPDSLMEEDKNLLREGIVLYKEEELAALLEDYTS